jgi:hypothetical protein
MSLNLEADLITAALGALLESLQSDSSRMADDISTVDLSIEIAASFERHKVIRQLHLLFRQLNEAMSHLRERLIISNTDLDDRSAYLQEFLVERRMLLDAKQASVTYLTDEYTGKKPR